MLVGLGLAIVVLVIFFLRGPRVSTDTGLTPLELPVDLDGYLQREESAVAGLIPGAEKTIIWAGERGKRTPLSVIYLHGFSACRQETAPLADTVAAALGANLFYTRFTGHGCGTPGMAQGSVHRWVNDVQEAMAIGSRIGERVIVIGFSTGGTIATWLASQPLAAAAAAFILVSPNYGLRDGRSAILTWPWAGQLAEVLIGPQYGWEPHNALHRRFWTCRFPTRALLPMMAMVKLAWTSDLASIRKPFCVLFSPRDQVVRVDAIRRLYSRIGSTTRHMVEVTDGGGSPNHHVLAGDILAPAGTGPLADAIIDFLRNQCGLSDSASSSSPQTDQGG